MKKRNMAILGMFMMMASLGVSKNHVFAADATASSIEVKSYNSTTNPSSNALNPQIEVDNNSGADINLSNLKLRYYYTEEGNVDQNFWCDYCGMKDGPSGYKNVDLSQVVGKFVKLDAGQSTDKASQYIEVSFGSGAGTLEKGAKLLIQLRASKTDWSNYDQSNDYSFNPTASSYVDANNIVGYVNGVQAWGTLPVSVPGINPTSGIYDQGAPADVTTVESLNGGKLNGITDEAGKPVTYTEDAATGKVTFSQTYLATLAVGEHTFTFNYTDAKGNSVPITFKLTVKPAPNPVVTLANSTFSKDDPKDVTANVSLNNSTFKDVKDSTGAVVDPKNYTVSSNSIVFSKDYLSTLTDGKHDYTIEFVKPDGSIYSVAITINVTSVQVKVNVGSYSGKAKTGDTVSVPVTVNTKVNDVEGIEAYIAYDSAKFKLTGVRPGELVKEAQNLDYTDNNGVVHITFTDETMGSELITADGLLAYLDFQLINDSAVGVNPLTVDKVNSGAMDVNAQAFNTLFTDGNITIIGVPHVTPTSGSYTIGSTQNVGTTVVSNGNTLKDVNLLGADQKTVVSTLKEGTDYTIGADGSFAFTQSYLSTLAKGTYYFSFDFSDGSSSIFTLIVSPDTTVNVAVGTISGAPGSSVAVPVTVKNVSASVEGVEAYIKYDNTKFKLKDVTPGALVKEAQNLSYTDDNGVVHITFTDETMGNELITADGILAYLNFDINSDTAEGDYALAVDRSNSDVMDLNAQSIKNKFSDGDITVKVIPSVTVNFGTTTGKAGTSVTVPVTVQVTNSKSVEGIEAYVKYDNTKFTLKGVRPGALAKEAQNLNYVDSNGVVHITFADETMGNELITADGILAYLDFDINSDTAEGDYAVTVDKSSSNVMDLDAQNIASAFNDGKITVSNVPPILVPVLNDKSGTFYLETAKQAPINVGITFNGKTLTSITNGSTELKAGTDYTVTSTGVTLSQAYLAGLQPGNYTLTFTFSDGSKPEYSLTVAPIPAPVLNDKTGTFYLETAKQAPINVGITFNEKTITSITNGDKQLTAGTDYTVTSTGVTLSQAYLAGLQAGNYTLTFTFSDGTKADYSLTVVAPIPVAVLNDKAGTFDLNPAKQAPINVSVTFNEKTITSITNGDKTLTAGTDYTVTSTGVTLSQAYLASLPVGSYTLTFTFSDGLKAEYSLTVVSTPNTKINVSVGTVSGAQGSSVVVPVKVEQVAKSIDGIEAYVKYDNTKFKLTGVTKGDLVKEDKNLSYADNNGVVHITFTDETMGSELITADGILAYLNFDINSDAAAGDYALAVDTDNSGVMDVDANYLDSKFNDGKISVSSAPLPAPVLIDTTGTFYLETAKQAPINVSVTFNGKTITSITNGSTELKAGTDYTVTSTGVTLSQAYLAGLQAGKYTLTFTFSDGSKADYSLTVVPAPVVVVAPVLIDKAGTFDLNTAKQAPINVGITFNNNTITSITNAGKALTAGTDYTVTSTGVTLSQAYLATLQKGSYTLTFTFSDKTPITYSLTVEDTTPVTPTKPVITLGSVSGKAGDIVTIAVTLAEPSTPAKIEGMELHLKYDATKFQIVGSSIGTANDKGKVQYSDNNTNGTANIQFFDDTVEETEPFTNSGIVGYIQVQIKAGAAAGNSTIALDTDKTSMFDLDANTVEADYNGGSITIE